MKLLLGPIWPYFKIWMLWTLGISCLLLQYILRRSCYLPENVFGYLEDRQGPRTKNNVPGFESCYLII